MDSKDNMAVKKSSTVKEWAKEVEFALKEALSIYEENTNSFNDIDLFKMAPAIAAIFNNIKSEKIKDEMIKVSWANVLHVHNEISGYKTKSKRCFAHAYLDSIIFLQLITVKKSEKVLDYLERKKIIETWQG